MKESIYKNAYNLINNGPIWNPLVLLESSQSPLCISFISFDTHDIRVNFYVLQVIKSFDLFDMIWKKVFTKMLITSLIMVRFEICLHCWNCLSLLYAFLLLVSTLTTWNQCTVLYIAMISFDTHDTQLNQENHHNTLYAVFDLSTLTTWNQCNLCVNYCMLSLIFRHSWHKTSIYKKYLQKYL